MKTTDLFESRPCSRCGGGGHYSYNQIDGTKCYGCNGSGIQLTKAGAEARDAWIAAYTVTVKAQNVKVGDRIMVTNPLGGRETLRVVTKSEADTLNVGQNRWNFRFEVKNPNGSELGGLGTFIDSEVRLPASAEDKQAAYEAISDMPGALGWPTEVK